MRKEGILQLAQGLDWDTLAGKARAAAPEAFASDGDPLNLIRGDWEAHGRPKAFHSPVDGSTLGSFPMLDPETARSAVQAAAAEFDGWKRVDLDERRRRISACLSQMRAHRELFAGLLVWEIGKPYDQALVSVDRCVAGVEWYVEQAESLLGSRKPLGLVSNIASWNYPMSVLMHAVLVQLLVGNVAIAKTPSDGGLFTLTLAMAMARREGLPVSLVSGSGRQLSEALVRGDAVDCLSFVGGKDTGRDIVASLLDRNKRYMLEMEGVNAYGIWHFSDWKGLKAQLRKGFEYGKQRCTAYTRYVVEKRLFPKFLEMYLELVGELRFGHPLLVGQPGDPPPTIAFGPLINDRSVEALNAKVSEALSLGAVAIHERSLDDGHFLPGQDTSAYFAPVALMNVPRPCKLYHAEPFGPVDTFVLVNGVEELVAEMNVSNGALVASIACDDPTEAQEIAGELRAFKVGINRTRSRGDREETFGGIGASWKGCFVGGKYLVHALTQGEPGEPLYGNFPDRTLLPTDNR
ncbi:aldehyde dehydrogenase family protein [Vulgatibacter incomptus]|uniref:Betaine aldehyde dehydrogenase n=1 Tax=Vulgatibacter incomptus TaxID=1391653 RepID=A0A0K1PHJ2_9BACT|nr:aldehyde dehydrogenase family protein [Vulgatibacter incomptus]AKU92584.1 Betaine aldehyde dehydrogenase [Vulgatibacter incomptus]